MIFSKSFLLLNCLLLSFTRTHKTVKINSFDHGADTFLDHFWDSTGFCPTGNRNNFLLSQDETLNLMYIGTLPNKAIKYVRIHWLLDLVAIRKTLSGQIKYDFYQLDMLIKHLHSYKLIPGFELMGNPSGYFHDFTVQGGDWTQLLKEIFLRYKNLYSFKYVNSWRFELMNEPDLKIYNTLNLTLDSYLKYFEASKAAISRLLGPAGLFRDNRQAHTLCWGLLDYCNLNKCNLKVLTFHRKGDGVGSKVVANGLELINTLFSQYPYLKEVPVGNDEADILTGWQKPMEWRADVRYAASVAQVVIGHVDELIVTRNISLRLLSNDNAFVSFYPHQFTQRTLLARFQMNNTTPKHVQFIKKPVYSVMALLSMLGNKLEKVQYHPGEPGVSYIITRDKFRVTLLATIVNDKMENVSYPSASKVTLKFRCKLRNSSSAYFITYQMDNEISNPYRTWVNAGRPDFPDISLRKEMRLLEGFRTIATRELTSRSKMNFYFYNIHVPTVLVINICYQNIIKPGRVTKLHYVNITNGEILLMWNDKKVKSMCLVTYLVEFKWTTSDQFIRIHDENILFLSYHFDGSVAEYKMGVEGEYKVTAVDYWQRRGPSSKVIRVP